ncbi:MAG: LysR substrate-binding domain-containing protein [Gammaproteobacteria bacterium]|nr:LysR substrate-binding domain-containing protein [Gammaproteobacteria bacterium]
MQPRLPLNNLNTFAEAAEHLSFQQAARSLFVTPSAVSHQIRNLENILGYKLFERLDKSVRLTARGERLFLDIRAPMRQLHEASSKAVRGREDNGLALSVAPAFATGWLLPRLRSFYAAHPDINLSVVATIELADFSSDPFDASIRMGSGSWDNTSAVYLFDQVLAAVCHPSLLANLGRLLTPAQVAGYPLILNAYMPDTWDTWFEAAGIRFPSSSGGKLEVQGVAQVVEALQSGDAIGLVDKNFIRQDLESGRLALACEQVVTGSGGYYLVHADAGADLPSLVRFKDWLGSQIAADGERSA